MIFRIKVTFVLILGLICSASTSTASTAASNSNLEKKSRFLSHQEWSNLSFAKQKKYLKGLQEIFAKMDERSDFFAQTSSETRSPSSSFRLHSIESNAQISLQIARGETSKAESQLRNGNKEQALDYYMTSMRNLGKARIQIFTLVNEDNKNKLFAEWTSIYESNRSLQQRLQDPVSKSEIERLNQTHQRFSKADYWDQNNQDQQPDVAYYFSDYVPRARTMSPAMATAASRPAVAHIPAPPPSTLATPPTSPKTSSIPPTAASTVQVSDEFFLCMYGGFIIKTGSCRGQTELPTDMRFNGVSIEKFNCEAPTILCNPLLFGARTSCPAEKLSAIREKKSQASECLPNFEKLCTLPSISATKDCQGLSQKDPRSLDVAVILIENNPQIWSNYTKSFDLLCNKEKINLNLFTQMKEGEKRANEEYLKQDIRKTCAWANEQLLKLKEKFKTSSQKPEIPTLDPSKGTL